MNNQNKLRTRAIFGEEIKEVVSQTREMLGLHKRSIIEEMRAEVNKGYFN